MTFATIQVSNLFLKIIFFVLAYNNLGYFSIIHTACTLTNMYFLRRKKIMYVTSCQENSFPGCFPACILVSQFNSAQNTFAEDLFAR